MHNLFIIDFLLMRRNICWPSYMLNSRPVRLLWHSFNWLTRITLVCAAAGAIMLALGIIVLRYWLLPDIEQYHEKITTSITRAIGRPVTIEKIAGDWQGLRPSLSLVNLAILDDQRNPALVLPSVRVSVSWLSLLTAELRFASLEIDRPELLQSVCRQCGCCATRGWRQQPVRLVAAPIAHGGQKRAHRVA
jgi:hypothetical protein